MRWILILLLTSFMCYGETVLLDIPANTDGKQSTKCTYHSYSASAVVKSIQKTPESIAQKKHANFEGYEILFSLNVKADKLDMKMNNLIKKPFIFLLNNGWYPGAAYIKKYDIKVGKKYPGILKIRKSGNCPRAIWLDEATLKSDDYFEGYLTSPFKEKEKRIKVIADKPVIYIYPEKKQEVIVKLGNTKDLLYTYPKYPKNGWKVTANSNGTLLDKKTNKKYYTLFWDAKNLNNFKFDEGVVVKGSEVADYLDKQLKHLGLNWKERNEFIIFWLPKLEKNEYNLIKFVTKEYEKAYPISISPKPDTLIRVFMIFKKVQGQITIKSQKLPKAKRLGYTVVEWGGSEIQ